VKKKPDYWYQQSAAAPVRIVDGRIEVLLVTTLHRRRWILPKGIIEPDMTPAEAAAQEAWEEGGVRGSMDGRSLGTYHISKWGGECSVDVFRMNAVKEFDPWPESRRRKRKWFGLDDALQVIYPSEAAAVLRNINRPGLALTLLRHAKSSWADPDIDDVMRPLNERGCRDAPEMGRRLRKSGVRPDLIVSSPATRALHTARIIAARIVYPETGILEDGMIYTASADELLEIVRGLPDVKSDVMLVGHNPALTDMANLFLRSKVENIPTCGMVRLAFEERSWRDIDPKRAKLLTIDYPKKNIVKK
jgi:phosphohistidine phosphatase